MSSVSVSSPSNIALIKYWGMSDAEQTFPVNASLSMTLSRCISTCTLETLDCEATDEVWWKGEDGLLVPANGPMRKGISQHVLRLRHHFDFWQPLRIITANTFPTGAGIASSASGFSALALAFASLCGQAPSTDLLSALARLSGSGSAARSVLGGFVQWPGDPGDLQSPPRQFAPPDHWPLHDLIAVVDPSPKSVSSREGHRRALSSPHFPTRQKLLPERLKNLQQAILAQDFAAFADAVECEAIELHMIAMTSVPPVFYWQPATLAVFYHVQQLRRDGLQVCATFDAGPNIHVLCTPVHQPAVSEALRNLPVIRQLIPDRIGDGPSITEIQL
ncbi:diphosphomevalonate decarboxylase [Pseudomonas akapageensis]|uniref:diphosphomevalonate decarboxylase n=1 Tax=Pseudomonas akapageensis TaxID=2609961 RepID=UPI0024840676|nr:diphosphomevalonate decarboxylase [Pseudomonas akapageensis]